MGDLRVTIEHGSGSGRVLAASAVVIGALALSAGASGLISATETAVCWIAGVTGVSVAFAAVIVVRAMRRRRPDYVRVIHGKTERDHILDENARIRREIAGIRAMRLEMERNELYYGRLAPGWMDAVDDYVQRGTITGRFGPIPGHEVIPPPQ